MKLENIELAVKLSRKLEESKSHLKYLNGIYDEKGFNPYGVELCIIDANGFLKHKIRADSSLRKVIKEHCMEEYKRNVEECERKIEEL